MSYGRYIFFRVFFISCLCFSPIFSEVLVSKAQNDNVKTEKEVKKYFDNFLRQCSILPSVEVEKNNKRDLIYVQNHKVGSEDEVQQTIFAPSEISIFLDCTAQEPIEWIFEGNDEPPIGSLKITRHSTNGSLESYDCFRVKIEIFTTKRSTGKYSCVTLSERAHKSSVYLYGDGNSPPLLLYDQKEFKIYPDKDGIATLPCQAVNPSLKPVLLKGRSGVIEIQGLVGYDPKVGFSVDVEKIPDPYDFYKCKEADSSVTFQIISHPDFRVKPPAEIITVLKGSFESIECEGKVPIGLQGFLDDKKVSIKQEESDESEYKYKVSYELSGADNEKMGISCVELLSKAVLHTWHITQINSEVNDGSGIFYDEKSNLFTCFSKTKEDPVMSSTLCNSPIECKLTDKCFKLPENISIKNSRKECLSKVARGSSCEIGPLSHYVENKNNQGCVYVEKSEFPSGTVYCTQPHDAQKLQKSFFTGFSNKVIFNWETAQISDLIKIVIHESGNLYTNQTLRVTCSTQRFIFGDNQLIHFKLDDGKFYTPNETELVEVYQKEESGVGNIIVKTFEFKLPKISQILCSAPLWNETRWLTGFNPINVTRSSEPKILTPQTSDPILLKDGDVDKIISCEAEGIPAPNVTWYKNGEILRDQVQTPVGYKVKLSKLYLRYVDKSIEGQYTCQAANYANVVQRTFSLSIYHDRKWILTYFFISLAILFGFLCIIYALWRKIRQNKSIIRRLTEEDEKKFREGDKQELKNAPEGYIRAQYLPYNSEYEIKSENLKIDEEVLGKGVYGVVKKGHLKNKDSFKEVAVKTTLGTDEEHFKALLSELKILTYIGWHKNVISLLGAVTKNLINHDVYVVIEYCQQGDLETFLSKNKNSFLNQITDEKINLNQTFNLDPIFYSAYQPSEYKIRTADLIKWSYQISSGMEYLSDRKVVHGDLATRNILLTEDLTIKITDFGLSKNLHDCNNYISQANMAKPWRIAAPEVLQPRAVYSIHSDVWSLGVTLWEIYSLGAVAYSDITISPQFRTMLLEGYRLPKPLYANSDIYNRILMCWKNVPVERVSFRELRRYFYSILHDIGNNEDIFEEEMSYKYNSSSYPLIELRPEKNNYVPA